VTHPADASRLASLARPGSSRLGRGLLVVSHACVVPENQPVYGELVDRGWNLALIVPDHWRHGYADGDFAPRVAPGLEGHVVAAPVALPGRPQRHFYRCRPGSLLRALQPRVIFVEEESYSVPAMQWAVAARRRGIPYGVQAYENLDRPLPRAARWIRSWVLPRAAFVAARSPAAADLARAWGAAGHMAVVPPAVPPWAARPSTGPRPFCVGFAGRLVPEKGIWDLVEAVRSLHTPVRLLFAGDGPLRDDLRSLSLPNAEVVVWTGLDHGGVAEAYGGMDVLVLPSRTTPTWAEQFGRVLVEALWCGVPVVGSDSGEIPWVIGATGGGLVVPEGDSRALAEALATLRDDAALRGRLARTGHESVARLFSTAAVADALEAALSNATGVSWA
jgi:glycosyltransferase involved in cell wall biosynthesis